MCYYNHLSTNTPHPPYQPTSAYTASRPSPLRHPAPPGGVGNSFRHHRPTTTTPVAPPPPSASSVVVVGHHHRGGGRSAFGSPQSHKTAPQCSTLLRRGGRGGGDAVRATTAPPQPPPTYKLRHRSTPSPTSVASAHNDGGGGRVFPPIAPPPASSARCHAVTVTPPAEANRKYKTEMCKNMMEHGHCRFGANWYVFAFSFPLCVNKMHLACLHFRFGTRVECLGSVPLCLSVQCIGVRIVFAVCFACNLRANCLQYPKKCIALPICMHRVIESIEFIHCSFPHVGYSEKAVITPTARRSVSPQASRI